MPTTVASETTTTSAANEAANGADRIRGVIPSLQARSGLLDLQTGTVR